MACNMKKLLPHFIVLLVLTTAVFAAGEEQWWNSGGRKMLQAEEQCDNLCLAPNELWPGSEGYNRCCPGYDCGVWVYGNLSACCRHEFRGGCQEYFPTV